MKPLILIIDDEIRLRELYSETLKLANFDTIMASSPIEANNIIKEQLPDMIVSDVRMPGMDGITFLKQIKKEYQDLPFLLITAYADIKEAVTALKLGAVDYLQKPIDLEELVTAVSDILHIQATQTKNEIPHDITKNFIVESNSMKDILNNAYTVAKSDVNVLLTGESGTGKEVLANFIHKTSARASSKLVTLNCASIPKNLLESELFGHIKGAFTGAIANRKGIFREAEGGTLFLDEIGDMPLELQPALLRAIENRTISPVGSDKEIDVNFRLLTATNKNLLKEVQNGNFREDLYYRLNVISFELPPLNERKEDIMPLVKFFISKRNKDKRISVSTTRVFQNYSWPGNIRELDNAIERACLLSNTDVILPEHLPIKIVNASKENIDIEKTDILNVITISQAEKSAIKNALESTNNNRTKAAELLGISRRTLITKIKTFKLN